MLTCTFVRTKDDNKLSQHIEYIHKNYLSRICIESEFQGLKYYGGPIVKCQCEEEGILECVSFTINEEGIETIPELTTTKECETCFTEHNVDQLLLSQVSL